MIFLKNKKFRRTVFIKKGSSQRKSRINLISSSFFYNFSRTIVIVFKQNNLFCNLISLSQNTEQKTIVSKSAGTLINVQQMHSKKPKKIMNDVISSFFFTIKNRLTQRGVFVKIIASKRFKKRLIKRLDFFKMYKKDKIVTRRLLFIKICDKKSFNGCRVSKRRRKKQKGRYKSLRCFK